MNHGFTAGWQRLVIFAQPMVLAEPAKGPFDILLCRLQTIKMDNSHTLLKTVSKRGGAPFVKSNGKSRSTG